MEKDNYTIQTNKIHTCIKSVSDNRMEIAQRICRVDKLGLYQGHYQTINDYANVEFGYDRRRVSECKKIVYKFCEERKNVNQYATGYCVKSLFREFKYSVLLLLTELKEDEIISLGITKDTSWRDVKKIVKGYMSDLMQENADDQIVDNCENVTEDNKNVNDDIKTINDVNVNPYNLKYSEMTIYMDDVYINNGKKKLSLIHGLNYLRDMVLKDNNYEYVVIKVKRNGENKNEH